MNMNVMKNAIPVVIETKGKPKMQEGVVFETTDYGMFQRLYGNRKKHEPQIVQLKRDIQQMNLLPQNPILVNEKMEVVNGQHRLQAAEELGIPIYFTFKFGASLREAKMLQHSRNWLSRDFLDSYVEEGKQQYIVLKNFAEKHRLSIPIAMQILTNKFNRDEVLAAFREGNFKVENLEQAEQLAELVSEVRRHSPDKAWTHRDCIRALAVVQQRTDPKNLTDQLERYQLVVTRRVSMKDYLKEFSLIINSNRKGKEIDLF